MKYHQNALSNFGRAFWENRIATACHHLTSLYEKHKLKSSNPGVNAE